MGEVLPKARVGNWKMADIKKRQRIITPVHGRRPLETPKTRLGKFKVKLKVQESVEKYIQKHIHKEYS